MMQPPLVSVICTCYNQAPYVLEALQSVINQNYKNVELLINDNGSTDGSVDLIEKWLKEQTYSMPIQTFFYEKKRNYCQVFNLALARAKGIYVADLAADDFFHPNHLEQAVFKMENNPASIYFCNANLIKENGDTQPFYPVDDQGRAVEKVQDGQIYAVLVKKYALCTATLVFDQNLLKLEGGYDESLNYEDFDITVRMARKYPFVYHDHVGVTKRELKNSFSASQYAYRNTTMLSSTLKVCVKIQAMNRSPEEENALKFRVIHETKHALLSANFDMSGRFLNLAKSLEVDGARYRLFRIWHLSRLDISYLYGLWRKYKLI